MASTLHTSRFTALIRAHWPIAILAIAVLAATWKLALTDRVIARGDLLLYFYPLRDFAAQAVREFRLPLWNDFTFMGSPFLANPQVGFFYPFNLLSAWLPAERAVLLQIPLHFLIAAWGCQRLCEQRLGLSQGASLGAGLLFGLGGYLGGQAEHINQLQALAWLPWLLMSLDAAEQTPSLAAIAGHVCRCAAIIALMFLAGHTQSLYLALVAAGCIAMLLSLNTALQRANTKRQRLLALAPLVTLGVAGVLAALLVGVQLLPTLELQSLSARSGGMLPLEVGAFSWRPWVMARALLPTFGDPLFPEYIAYLGSTGIALALLGVVSVTAWPHLPKQQRIWWVIALALCVMGVLLALGVAITPLFNFMYRRMPGFGLFRVQARWLALFGLGAALMAGFGLQALRRGIGMRTAIAWLLALLLAGAAWLMLYRWGLANSPEAEYRAEPLPGVARWWQLGALAAACAMLMAWLLSRSRARAWAPALGAAMLLAELVVAAQWQPHAVAADAQALRELRPGIAHLLNEYTQPGRGRTLSLSSLNFDPGDKLEMTLIYTHTLSQQELYERVVATKQKEILSPNFSLWYRVPGVDGYDGGLLPTREYAAFVQPLLRPLPNGAPRPVDGRLREFLDSVPSNSVLDQMGVEYVLADKTADVFVNNVYYDVLISEPISKGLMIGLDRPFSSTALGLLFANTETVRIEIAFADGSRIERSVVPTREVPANTPVSYGHAYVAWPGRRLPTVLRIAADQPTMLRAISSIDSNNNSFVSQMVNGDHRLKVIYSGDTKLYQRTNYNAAAALRFTELERRFRDEPRSLWLGGALSALGLLLWAVLAMIALRHASSLRSNGQPALAGDVDGSA